jgi:hypothetical protein
MAVFWDVALCSLVDINQCLRGAPNPRCYIITLMKEAVSFSEMSVNIFWSTQRNIQEDCHLYTQHAVADLDDRTQVTCNIIGYF